MTPDTTYTIYQRVKDNGTFIGASDASSTIVNTLSGVPSYDVIIDSKHIATVDEGYTFVLPDFADEDAVLYTDGTNFYDSGETIIVNSDIALKTAKLSVSMKPGASIRLDENAGLRFYTDVDSSLLSELKKKGAKLEFGTIITACELVKDCDITLDTENVAIIPYEAELASINEDGFVGSVVNFKQDNIKKEYVARGYVKVTKDGVTKTYYANNPESTVRSVFLVSNLLKEDITLYNLLPDDAKSKVSLWASE